MCQISILQFLLERDKDGQALFCFWIFFFLSGKEKKRKNRYHPQPTFDYFGISTPSPNKMRFKMFDPHTAEATAPSAPHDHDCPSVTCSCKPETQTLGIVVRRRDSHHRIWTRYTFMREKGRGDKNPLLANGIHPGTIVRPFVLLWHVPLQAAASRVFFSLLLASS